MSIQPQQNVLGILLTDKKTIPKLSASCLLPFGLDYMHWSNIARLLFMNTAALCQEVSVPTCLLKAILSEASLCRELEHGLLCHK